MTAKTGYYTMDAIMKQLILEGIDDCENIGDIPIRVLFEVDRGSLAELPDTIYERVLSFVPTRPSAFDSNLMLLRNEFVSWGMTTDIVIDALLMKYHVTSAGMASTFLNKYVRAGVQLVFKHGIGNEMKLKWIAARGPWPEHVDERTLKTGMQGVFYILIELSKRTITAAFDDPDTTRELYENVRSDLNCIVSIAWTGVHGWRD